MYAWLGLAGSTAMPLMNRPGAAAEVLSMRVNDTELAGSASAFLEMNTRPAVVAAHKVEVSPVPRATAATLPPERLPNAPLVNVTAPSGAQSPHCTVKSPVNSLQCT